MVQKTSFDRNEPGGGKPGDVGTKAAAPEAAGAAQCEHQGIFDLLWRYGAGEGYTQLIARQGTETANLRGLIGFVLGRYTQLIARQGTETSGGCIHRVEVFR